MAVVAAGGAHPIHTSKSPKAALTFPLAPSAILRVIRMGAPHRRARKAARASFAGGWRRSGSSRWSGSCGAATLTRRPGREGAQESQLPR